MLLPGFIQKALDKFSMLLPGFSELTYGKGLAQGLPMSDSWRMASEELLAFRFIGLLFG